VSVPQPGDFGLTKINGAGGALIRIGQWLNGSGFRDFEHAFIVGPYVDGELTVIEAEPGGARQAKLSEYDPAKTVYSSWLLTTAERQAIVSMALFKLGTGYSWLDYASLALHRFYIRPGFVKRRVENLGHMICSQLVDFCYDMAGLRMFRDGRWPGDVTPGDLYDRLGGPQ
jgi:hypothetical protein